MSRARAIALGPDTRSLWRLIFREKDKKDDVLEPTDYRESFSSTNSLEYVTVKFRMEAHSTAEKSP